VADRRAGALAAVLALLVALVVGGTVADASGLPLAGRSLLGVVLPRCGDAAAVVSPASLTTSPASGGAVAGTLTGTGLDPACAGRPVDVLVYRRATGATVTTGTATVSPAGGFAVTPAAAYPASGDLAVRLTVGGWAAPAVWAPPVSCVAVNDPTRTCEVRWTVTSGTVNVVFWSYQYYRIAYTVTSPSATATTQWRVTFDLATFATWLPARIRRLDAAVTTPASCVTLPTLQLQGGAAVGGGATFSGSVQLDRSVVLDGYDDYPLC
jgi:hypothetical protein